MVENLVDDVRVLGYGENCSVMEAGNVEPKVATDRVLQAFNIKREAYI